MRTHGARGRVYAALTTSTAEPVANLSKWTMDMKPAGYVDCTAAGSLNKTYVARKRSVEGTFAGFYDSAAADTYTAATDGLSRRFYLYPTSQSRPYFFGEAIIDYGTDGSIDDAVKTAADWTADEMWFVSVDGSFSTAFSAAFDGGFGL